MPIGEQQLWVQQSMTDRGSSVAPGQVVPTACRWLWAICREKAESNSSVRHRRHLRIFPDPVLMGEGGSVACIQEPPFHWQCATSEWKWPTEPMPVPPRAHARQRKLTLVHPSSASTKSPRLLPAEL